MLNILKARSNAAAARSAMRSMAQMNPTVLADIGMSNNGAVADPAAFDLQWALARSTGG